MLPTANTTGTILRAPAGTGHDEPYSGVDAGTDFDEVTTGVRAVIDIPSGTETVAGGEQTTVALRLLADPCDLRDGDHFRDDTTGRVFRVTFAVAHPGPIPHVEARLSAATGLT